MANFPTYNPADFQKVEDQAIFSNANVTSPLEVGSIMKPLTAAAALNQQVVSINSTYYDPSFFVVDTKKITNIAEDGGPGTHTIADILQMSLNTGATWLLMQMGGGTINQTARMKWHEYMVDHYQFGKKTGVEQSGESGGYVPDPNDGFGLNIQYANTSFGQGMSQTPLQMASALASVVNGGTYYKPTLVSGFIGSDGNFSAQKSVIVKDHVVDATVAEEVRSMMVYTVQKNHALYTVNLRPGYNIGGKTGTAQIGKPDGGYYDEKSNGTFYGFVGGDTPEYVIMVRVNEPNVAGYAGPRAAAPIFAKLVDMLINNFGVSTKTN
jgi:cell division protein FtsI/penicillin-binding protein 2